MISFRQAESLLDVSDMSFDETGDLLGDSRRPMNVTGANKRRSSHRFEAAQKRRKSKSIGTKLEGDEMLKVCSPQFHFPYLRLDFNLKFVSSSSFSFL